MLLTEVYPELRQFCQSLGLEFQVVDMRYGVRDEETDRHLVTELCLDEIRRCHQMSVGPTFVVGISARKLEVYITFQYLLAFLVRVNNYLKQLKGCLHNG